MARKDLSDIQPVAPSFSAVLSSSPTSASSYTGVVWNSVEWDSHGWYNATNGRFTPLLAGVYQFCASVGVGGGSLVAGDYINVQVVKVGGVTTTKEVGSTHGGSNAGGWGYASNGSCLYKANGTTDYFRIDVQFPRVVAIYTSYSYFQAVYLGA